MLLLPGRTFSGGHWTKSDRVDPPGMCAQSTPLLLWNLELKASATTLFT
jgi:hypothetical protein